MTIYDTLKTAIQNRKCVKGKYSKDKPGIRKYCPHVLGTNSSGQQVVLVYQFSGYSAKPIDPAHPEVNWRCLQLTKLSLVGLIGSPFFTPSNYSATKQTNVASIDYKI